MRFAQFFAGFFREDRPESFARGITFVIVAFVMGWDTSYVIHSHTLIDVGTMAGQVLFMTAFYFGGKGISAVTAIKAPQCPPSDPEKGGNQP